VRLLTDPLLRERVFYVSRRVEPVNTTDYHNIDLVLISHLHLDHLDIPSLRMLGLNTRLIVPVGAAKLLQNKGFKNVCEMQPGDAGMHGLLSIEATHAEHHSRYPPTGLTTPALGFVVRASHRVYFSGDTDIFPGMSDLDGNLDVALLPIGGWGPNLGPGHMNPLRAAEALTLLRPRHAIPIHWGTFYPLGLDLIKPPRLTEPPQIFLAQAASLAPQVQIHILTPGDSLSLPSES
jgi:L-ascorbate metabolism protein UlaG (beta-lactamase superfamily)